MQRLDCFTAAEAATLMGVKPETIRSWFKRGHLPEAGRNTRGDRLYAGADILTAEAKTRRHARRA